MCLATVIKKKDGSAIFKNVSRIDVQDGVLLIRDIMGDEKEVKGAIRMVDLANSIVEVDCVE
ncbi:MAG: CooT family nickel-binding protein [Lachnospiraceae bacterium]|jgi:predicted RNA-binding protein|nr:CooT family nickel-binding protein [Lachnospiraceae bacterium]MCI9098595.1 CooT family nickel-binding protein [Lachnospiraceae bacterium]MCI9359071.1 CooT family nickel-binding protein [Lachnospiraceae bacterium]